MEIKPEKHDFASFSYRMKEAGLSTIDHGNGHWTVTGGKWIVHFWPFSQKGTIWAEGTNYKKSNGTIDYVIRVAKGHLQIPPSLIVNGKAAVRLLHSEDHTMPQTTRSSALIVAAT